MLHNGHAIGHYGDTGSRYAEPGTVAGAGQAFAGSGAQGGSAAVRVGVSQYDAEEHARSDTAGRHVRQRANPDVYRYAGSAVSAKYGQSRYRVGRYHGQSAQGADDRRQRTEDRKSVLGF